MARWRACRKQLDRSRRSAPGRRAPADRRRAPGIEERQRRTADDLPAARRGLWIHARLRAGDAHRAGRYAGARRGLARHGKPWIEPAQIGKSRREAKEIDPVQRAGVALDHGFGGKPCVSRDRDQVRTVLPAVTNRDADFTWWCGRIGHLVLLREQCCQRATERVVRPRQWIVVQRQRRVGRHEVAQAGQRGGTNCRASAWTVAFVTSPSRVPRVICRAQSPSGAIRAGAFIGRLLMRGALPVSVASASQSAAGVCGGRACLHQRLWKKRAEHWIATWFQASSKNSAMSLSGPEFDKNGQASSARASSKRSGIRSDRGSGCSC